MTSEYLTQSPVQCRTFLLIHFATSLEEMRFWPLQNWAQPLRRDPCKENILTSPIISSCSVVNHECQFQNRLFKIFLAHFILENAAASFKTLVKLDLILNSKVHISFQTKVRFCKSNVKNLFAIEISIIGSKSLYKQT